MSISNIDNNVQYIKILEKTHPAEITVRKLDTIEVLNILDIYNNKFSIITTKFGSVALSCEGIKEYLGGSELSLKIGNITAAKLGGTVITFSYNAGNGRKTKKHEMLEDLVPASWTMFKVVFPDLKPSDIRSIFFTIDVSQMALISPVKKH